MPTHVLILDTPRDALLPLARVFEAACGPKTRVERVDSAQGLFDVVARGLPDLVVIDQLLGDGSTPGQVLLPRLRDVAPRVAVLLVAEHGDVGSAGAAVAAGATDFLVRKDRLPERVETFLRKLRRILALTDENRRLRTQPDDDRSVLGCSPQIREVQRVVERVAMVPRPVFIVGERGTGKEFIARSIHAESGRRGPFGAVNCVGLEPDLIEAELFGAAGPCNEACASSGRGLGKLEAADRGTLYLDGVDALPLVVQERLLRGLEHGFTLGVQDGEEHRADVRIIAATTVEPKLLIENGRLRADLYDRLAFELIRVPPLRERKEDVSLLAKHFLHRFLREVPSFSGRRLSEGALTILRDHPFPGNVRELKNIIERAVYRGVGEVVHAHEMGLEDHPSRPSMPAVGSFRQRLEAFERRLVVEAVDEAEGNQARAARLLGLPYHQLRYYYKKHFGGGRSSGR